MQWLLNRHAPKWRRAKEYMDTQRSLGYPRPENHPVNLDNDTLDDLTGTFSDDDIPF